MRKIIDGCYYWVCENFDLLAPIIEEGTEYLLSDNSLIQVPYNDKTSDNYNLIKSLEVASEEERKKYANEHYNVIFKGDKVIIARGRKMKGEEKIVNGYYRFDVRGTYGHQYTEYLFFTDGTKVNINHCDVVGINHQKNFYNNTEYFYRHYEESIRKMNFNVGGRKG